MKKNIAVLFAVASFSGCIHGGAAVCDKLIRDGYKLGHWMVVDHDDAIAARCGIYVDVYMKVRGRDLHLVTKSGARAEKKKWAITEFQTLETDLEWLKIFAAMAGLNSIRQCQWYK